MNKEAQRISNKINQRYEELRAKKDELRQLSLSINNKNAVVFQKINQLKEKKREEYDKVNPIRKIADEIKEKLVDIDRQLAEIEKKGYKGKKWKKEKLVALIESKEDEFRNTKKTA